MYQVVLTNRAERDLKNIDISMQRIIVSKIKEYAQNPLRYARKLITPKIGTYRFRIGDYRVIFDIDDKNIVILRIGHRSSIYK